MAAHGDGSVNLMLPWHSLVFCLRLTYLLLFIIISWFEFLFYAASKRKRRGESGLACCSRVHWLAVSFGGCQYVHSYQACNTCDFAAFDLHRVRARSHFCMVPLLHRQFQSCLADYRTQLED